MCVHCLLRQECKVQLRHQEESRQFLQTILILILMPAPGLVRNAAYERQTDTMLSSTTPAATPRQSPQPCTAGASPRLHIARTQTAS